MKVSTITTVFALAMSAVALPENTPAAREAQLEASTLAHSPGHKAAQTLTLFLITRSWLPQRPVYERLWPALRRGRQAGLRRVQG